MEAQYLGDGVYVSYRDGNLWLSANEHRNEVVCLEPAVMDRLIMYYTESKKKFIIDDDDE